MTSKYSNPQAHKLYQIKGESRALLVSKCQVADTFWLRLLGYMGRKFIDVDEAMMFPRCNSIHTFFMRCSIDVLFLSKDYVVTDIVTHIKPWRFLLPRWKACHVVEMRGGAAAQRNIVIGSHLVLEGDKT